MILTIWFGAAAMLSLAAGNLRLLLAEAAALNQAGPALAPRR